LGASTHTSKLGLDVSTLNPKVGVGMGVSSPNPGRALTQLQGGH
jgi:hypothetical protein